KRLHARLGLPVDGARVAVQSADPAPVYVHGVLEGLTNRTAVSGSRKGDTAQIAFTDLFRNSGKKWLGVHVAWWKRLSEYRACAERQQGKRPKDPFDHVSSRVTPHGA